MLANPLILLGAGGGNRTRMRLPSLDFESNSLKFRIGCIFNRLNLKHFLRVFLVSFGNVC